MFETKYTNRLIHESSPYLLQHAHNPVDWYPWDEEAFTEAKRRNLPILISVGYRACHWCHVMERESFEDSEIAGLMNQYFINIKVDREERPDIDQIYQEAIQLITGQGGWPLTVFLDHDRRPFYGGTYYPPEPMYGRISFPQLLEAIHDKWVRQRGDIHQACKEMTDYLNSNLRREGSSVLPDPELPIRVVHELSSAFDQNNGGFGGAPKFPNPALLQLFLKVGKNHHQPIFIDRVIFSLQQMAKGGIYDQLGGGFHRYSTDQFWLAPHFEKMLYDNAQLLKLYSIGYQLTKSAEFKTIAQETADYIRREMTAPEGGFYATQDADSEGQEGLFFIWDYDEIKQLLTGEEMEALIPYFHLSEAGNFEGRNILNRLTELPDDINFEQTELIHRAKRKLLEMRERRVKPFRDEKILTSWNGLMIGALAYTYQVFRRDEDYQSAKAAAEFILKKVKLTNGQLARVFKDGQVKIEAMLDDYTFLAQGLFDLYESDFNPLWLEEAVSLTKHVQTIFSDGYGKYSLTPANNDILFKPISGQDQAIPSGVSVHCDNLIKAAGFSGEPSFRDEVQKILSAYREEMMSEEWGHAGLIAAVDLYYQGIVEMTFIDQEPSVPEMLYKIWETYLPNRILARNSNLNGTHKHYLVQGLFKDRPMIQGKTTGYICSQNRCFSPITNSTDLEKILQRF